MEPIAHTLSKRCVSIASSLGEFPAPRGAIPSSFLSEKRDVLLTRAFRKTRYLFLNDSAITCLQVMTFCDILLGMLSHGRLKEDSAVSRYSD